MRFVGHKVKSPTRSETGHHSWSRPCTGVEAGLYFHILVLLVQFANAGRMMCVISKQSPNKSRTIGFLKKIQGPRAPPLHCISFGSPAKQNEENGGKWQLTKKRKKKHPNYYPTPCVFLESICNLKVPHTRDSSKTPESTRAAKNGAILDSHGKLSQYSPHQLKSIFALSFSMSSQSSSSLSSRYSDAS